MDTDSAIYEFLFNTSAIAALVSDRISDTIIGRDPEYPYILYNQGPGAGNTSTLQGQSLVLNKNYSIECVGAPGNRAQAVTVREAVRTACINLKAAGNTEISITDEVAIKGLIYLDEESDTELSFNGTEETLYSYTLFYSFSFTSTA